MNYKLKIIIASTLLAVTAGVLLLFIFPMLNRQNTALADQLEIRKLERENLDSERRSIAQGQNDLKRINSSTIKPEEFFSTDKKLVSEVRRLEAISTDYSLELDLKVSGTAAAAVPVPKTVSGIISIPFTMTVRGQFENIVRFLDAYEQLPFVTHIRALNITSAPSGEGTGRSTSAQLNGFFYLRK